MAESGFPEWSLAGLTFLIQRIFVAILLTMKGWRATVHVPRVAPATVHEFSAACWTPEQQSTKTTEISNLEAVSSLVLGIH